MANTAVAKNPEAETVRYATPRVEINENEKAIYLFADMPGVGSNGANVELNDHLLSMEGAVEKADNRPARHYRRRFTLSDPALFDLDAISAKMRHGVLEVEIPKTAKPQPRQIKIAAS